MIALPLPLTFLRFNFFTIQFLRFHFLTFLRFSFYVSFFYESFLRSFFLRIIFILFNFFTNHFYDQLFYEQFLRSNFSGQSYRTQGPAADTILTFLRPLDLPLGVPSPPVPAASLGSPPTYPWDVPSPPVPAASLGSPPHLPLRCYSAANLSAILPADWALHLRFSTAMFQVHERSIESGRGHNVCGGFATLKSARSCGQFSSEFVVPSGTKEENEKCMV